MTRCETVRARRVVERKKTHPPALAGIATDSSSHVGKIASCSSLARRSSQMYAPPATVKTATQNDGPLGQAQRQFEERVRFAGGDHLVVDLGDFGDARDQVAGADDVASARLRHVPNRHVDRAALRLSLAVGSDVDIPSPTHGRRRAVLRIPHGDGYRRV